MILCMIGGIIMKMETIKNIGALVALDLIDYLNSTDLASKSKFKGFTISAKQFLTDDGNNYRHVLYNVDKEEDRLVFNIAMLLDYFTYDQLETVVYDMAKRVNKKTVENNTEEEITKRLLDYFEYKFNK